ncbi:MAG TPA: glycoside hydrolase family 36 N-terminal domain-containing protein, partial [Anaerolineales bacterium]|nr:glycoside hydrolase family 36 N-terminal domain-containing protein [Anaerolineales bacterium]
MPQISSSTNTLHFSTRRLELTFQVSGDLLNLSHFTVDGHSWQPSQTSGLFALHVKGKRMDARQFAFESAELDPSVAGVQHVRLTLRGHGIAITSHLRLYDDTALIEWWPVIENIGEEAVTLERVDSLALALPEEITEWRGFTGDWGSEFEPVRGKLSNGVVLESRAGRASKGHHPWVEVSLADGRALAGAVAWSGNWTIRLEPVAGQGVQFTAGIHDWAFTKVLAVGESFEGVPVMLCAGNNLNDVSQQFARAGRKHWYPKNDFATQLPVEWNHWWPYEDAEIHETVFLQNVEQAASLGVEVCTLDAGWFGPSEGDTHWYDVRGDW